MVGGPERWRWLDMMKDEPPTSKPLPATCCHCPLGTRVATAASGKSTAIDGVTNHCTETRQVTAILHSKQQPRCTIQQRRACRSSSSAPPACEALQNSLVQRLHVEPTEPPAHGNQLRRASDSNADGRVRSAHTTSATPSCHPTCRACRPRQRPESSIFGTGCSP